MDVQTEDLRGLGSERELLGDRPAIYPGRDKALAEARAEAYRLGWLDGQQVGRDQAEADPQTITAEAEAAVYGDRNDSYGHPREDFTRTAILWTGLLHHKLADGEHIDAEDIARCQIAVKLARDVHAPKRDNRVDIAGYALTLDRLETGK